jgi:hypothetical protein
MNVPEVWLDCWWTGHDEPRLWWSEMPPDTFCNRRTTHHVFVGKTATVHVTSDEPVSRAQCLIIASARMSGEYYTLSLNDPEKGWKKQS